MSPRQRLTIHPTTAAGLPVAFEPGSLRAEIVGRKGRLVDVGETDLLVEYDDPRDEVRVLVSVDTDPGDGAIALTSRITINRRPTLWERVRAWWERRRQPPYVVPFEDDYPEHDG